jgi:acetolactate synthase-1/2/3 large subunit
MVCDAKLGLQDLISMTKQIIDKPAKHNQVRLTEVTKLIKVWNEKADAELNSDVIPIKGHRLVKELRNALTPNDLLIADTGSETIWTSLFYEIVESGRNYLCAAGSLGWSFPASIGAKLAAGDRKVLTLIGDGGIGYHIGEFETAVRYHVPFVTVVLNNMSWARPPATLKYAVDFGKLATASGGFGIRVERPGDLASALKEDFESDQPAIVDVVVDRKESGYVALLTSRMWISQKPTKLAFM